MDQQQVHLADFEAITLKLASPDEILAWSYGEITKPETINYRTGRPERDGLFDERIFGPTKDWECYCGKYRRIRYKGIVCDKCGVEVTRSIVRRDRMGHIKLASPVSHIWFLRGIPSKIGLMLDLSVNDLEKVIYFAGYIITSIDEDARKTALNDIESEFKAKSKGATKEATAALKDDKEEVKKELRSLRVHQVISEVGYHRMSRKFGEVFEASIGAEAIHHILSETSLEELKQRLETDLEQQATVAQRKILRRLRVINGMLTSGIRPEWMFLTVIPVIPPGLRPMVQLDGGRYATSDLNDLYRRVINRNNRLKRLFELHAPEVITRNEKRMLQEAVDALIDNSIRRGSAPVASQAQRRPLKSLADILKGKQGRFRQNLLGKRVDYSGRSVIVVGPDLALHQCGVPKKMALELFKPFVIRRLIEQEVAHNVRSAGKCIEEQDERVWAVLEEVIKGRYVLLNRAPTLHRLGIQAFQPVLIEGNSIQLHPMVCSAFNADFDGDQMAVHLPLTEEAQQEAREIMLSAKNLLKPATGEPIVNPDKDVVLGCYFSTTIWEGKKGEGKAFSSEEEVLLAYEFGAIDIQAGIRVRIKKSGEILETSVGRIMFNRLLPDDFPFVNKQLKSKNLAEVVADIIKQYGIEHTPPLLDKIKKFGFEEVTRSGHSWGMKDLIVPEEKTEIIKKAEEQVEVVTGQFQRGLLTDKERYGRVVEIWQEVVNEITALVPTKLLSSGSVYSMVDSRARGQWTQIRQMSGLKGLVVNPASRIIELPILSSYKEGFNALEFFISTHGARKGTADTALRTSAAGYLTRRLVDVAQDVIVTQEDCGTNEGYIVSRAESEEINKSIGQRVFSRVLGRDVTDSQGTMLLKKGEVVDLDAVSKLQDKDIEEIFVRSPLTCESVKGICQQCYGFDLGNNQLVTMGSAVGIVAAQAIGEPGTQLTMRTFHIGGVAGDTDITAGLPRVQEIFEVRPPKGKAVVSDVSGEILEVTEEGREKVVKVLIDYTDDIEEPILDPDAKPARKKKTAKKREETKEFRVPPNIGLFLQPHQSIARGEIITEGHADLRELFRFAGIDATKRYIIKEVQKIYSLQGAPIHDKHIEVIVRQMFSRLNISDSGDTDLSVGDIVEQQELYRVNEGLEDAGKRIAKGHRIILGITRVALSTSSFLSAASFQETARILIDSAIRGKRDDLRGLKENVIIGHLIPAGTGYNKKK